MKFPHLTCAHVATAALLVVLPGLTTSARAAPSAEVAKKCLSYAYRVYPYKRPGAAQASNGRQLYFSDCLRKNGDVGEPPLAARTTGNDAKPAN